MAMLTSPILFSLTHRWGHDHDPICMQMDEVLANTSEQMKNFAIIYLVDISKVRGQILGKVSSTTQHTFRSLTCASQHLRSR